MPASVALVNPFRRNSSPPASSAAAISSSVGSGCIEATKVATDSQGVAYEGDRAGTTVAPTVVFGYRYVPPERGISFGIGFTPLLRASKFLPWGGASAGYVF